jgi:hypothetical protein
MGEEQALEELLIEEKRDEDDSVSRRQFLTGAVVGGAAGLAVAAGTGAAVWKIADTETQVALDTADAEIARLNGIIELYEEMDKVGLDSILQSGMAAMALPLQAVEVGAKALKAGLETIEEALISLEEALPTARESILWLEAQVSAVAEGIEKLEASLGRVLEKASDSPVAQTLADFTAMVLDNLPFGLGDKIREVLEGLVGLVTSVDELVEGINTRILEPLRANWFSAEEGEGLGAVIVDPLIEHVLDPVEAHLTDLVALADTWQAKLVEPTQQALEERAQLRQQIAVHKGDSGLV